MGSYPRQDFIYGFYTEEIPDYNGDKGGVYEFCKENGLAYSYSYGGVAIGVEPDWTLITGETYLGGYYVTEFNLDAFNRWYNGAKVQLEEDTCNKIKSYLNLNADTKPTLWTISDYD